MNRKRRLALITPLVASSVALAPAVAAAQGSAEEVPGSASALPTAKCALVLGTSAENEPATYDLKLSGFNSGQRVTITSSSGREDVRVRSNGKYTSEDVDYGDYSVKGRNLSITCSKVPEKAPEKAPPKKEEKPSEAGGPVEVTDVNVALTPGTPDKVDCSKTNTVAVDGSVIGTGKGKVPLLWTLPNEKKSPSSVEFTGGATQTITVTKVVSVPPRATPTDTSVSFAAVLDAPKNDASSGKVTIKINCQ
ncbi:hypothetical protein GCM10020367_41830 [Streptomyces sannanensis]|uniref:Secreted protein n=1 Tax=Streptomyces sannanensis TaxID=285536 RepID=A0ABP6SEW5_9ACTN